MRHLDRQGMSVPVPISTTDGRYFADGLVVMTHVEGAPPETEGLDDDRCDVAAQAYAACWDPTGADSFAAGRLAGVRPL